MAYEAKNFEHLLGTKGFSDALLKNHFTLYQGYVANTNKLAEALASLAPGTPEYAELRRRFGWEFNGMRLHELYFENMAKGGKKLEAGARLAKKIVEDFGSLESWEKDFKGVGGMRGIGWAILYYDRETDRLFNTWIGEHDVGHLAGCAPLLVMDVFEHAYMLDYGLRRADYIAAFFEAIDWSTVEKRFRER
ncbi:MAG: Fe-Mn family superoxide dismutase [Candidatus Micrarchaeia archaeon]